MLKSNANLSRLGVPICSMQRFISFMLCAGLYIGSMGPHSAEVVQLQRKYGNWQTNDTLSINQELQCFEYVEAVKLTGDVNVPAGQVHIYLDYQLLGLASSELIVVMVEYGSYITCTEMTVNIRAGVFPCPSGKRQSFATQGSLSRGAWCCKTLSFKETIVSEYSELQVTYCSCIKHLLAFLFRWLSTRNIR